MLGHVVHSCLEETLHLNVNILRKDSFLLSERVDLIIPGFSSSPEVLPT